MAEDIQAHLADGSVLHFPAGTDPAVIEKIVKAKSAPPEDHRLKDSLVEGGKAINDFVGNLGFPGMSTLQNFLIDKAAGNKTNLPNEIINSTRPIASLAPSIEMASKAAQLTPGGVIPKSIVGTAAGVGSYIGIDQILQKVREMSGGDPASLGSSASQLVENEVGGRLVGMGMKKLTPAQEKLSKLSPTFSQYFEGASIPKAMEDLLAPKQKAEAIRNSGTAADNLVTQEAQKLSGRSAAVLNDPQFHAQKIQVNNLENALDSTFKEADKQASSAKLIAKGNPHTVIVQPASSQTTPNYKDLNPLSQSMAGKTYDKLNPSQQQGIDAIATKMGIQPTVTTQIPAITKMVEGPVALATTLEKANQIVEESKGLALGPSDQQKPVINQAYKLLQATNAQFDPNTGKLVSSNPISFDEAWNQKQGFDKLGGWEKTRNDVTPADHEFRQFSRLLNDDIDNSIPQWKNGSKQAFEGWKNAKETVAQRNQIFFPEGSNTKLGDIVQEADSPLKAIDDVIKDPVKLQRALNSGHIVFPSGKVYANNMRGDLGAANLKSLFANAMTVDPNNPQQLTVNATKLVNDWRDLRVQASNKLLYNSQQRSDYDQLFKNIAATQQKQNPLGARYAKLWLVKTGMILAPSMLAGTLSHSGTVGATFAGVELGAMGLAKLMANPKTARFLVQAAAGQPLNASEQAVAKSIAAGLQGITISLIDQAGKRINGQYDRQGQFQEEDPRK